MKQAAGDALRQAFMPKEDYDLLREEERAWNRLARPLIMTCVSMIWIFVVIAAGVMIDILFALTGHEYPFCEYKGLEDLTINPEQITENARASFLLTEEEAAQYFWTVIFLPTFVILLVTVIYLFAGIAVAYSAPNRHGCLKVVENNCCASQGGGVQCLATINILFLVVFVLLGFFLGSTILNLETDCSVSLFWCYEVVCWGMVVLLAGCTLFLRRKAAVIMDAGEIYGHHTVGVELLEASSILPLERRVAEGFKAWSGAPDSDYEGGDQIVSTGLDDVWVDDESDESYQIIPGRG